MDDTCKSEQDELKELRTLIQNNLAIDNQAHKRIEETLQRVITASEVAQGVAQEKEKSETSLRKQVFALLLILLAQTASMVSWIVTKFDRVESNVAVNSAHFKEFQGIGIRWGEDIDARAVEMQEQLRDLRKRVHGIESAHNHRGTASKD